MPLLANVRNPLLGSALSPDTFAPTHHVQAWLEERARAYQYRVDLIPLDQLNGWFIDPLTLDLSHVSGKFFTVTGLHVDRAHGTRERWSQPIVVQPEAGILGFIAKRIGGVLHVLVQAKMEPGNPNLVQLSPTVQATRSNYSQVHGGRRPLFLEYFVEPNRGVTLVDQLQSEQGARYLHKRNRNVVIQVPDDHVVPEHEDFMWVTLGQLTELTRFPNLVHLDCRSIIGSLCMHGHEDVRDAMHASDSFGRSALDSLLSPERLAEHSLVHLLGWFAGVKLECELRTHRVPLRDVTAWAIRDGAIRHELDRFFSIVGVRVSAASREVTSWSQPLVRSADGGILGLIAQRRRGVMHFLVQARAEPGFIDAVELAPTVQCNPANYGAPLTAALPPFLEHFQSPDPGAIRVDTVLADEGGRFYHSEQRHLIVELPEGESIDVPPHYAWMTLGQLQTCARFSNMLNIELRSVLSCIPLR